MAVDLEVRKLKRRKLRYRLSRISNDIPIDDADGIREFFEGQPKFDGWHNFTKTWDVGNEGAWPNGHWKAITLKQSAEEAWNERLLEVAPEYPEEQGE